MIRGFARTLTLTTNLSSYNLRHPFSSSTFAIKNVTRDNFDSVFENLKNHIKQADFVSVDLEMTGVTSAPWRDSFDFDRNDIRYLKIKDSVEKFAVVQFGVCPFRWDDSKKSFIAHPHNFYVFPRKELPFFDGPADEFLCQATSIDFLAKYKFDFNACIHQGISYLSREQEAEARDCLKLACDESNLEEFEDSTLISSADTLFKCWMKKYLEGWRDSLLMNTNGGVQTEENFQDITPMFKTVFYKMRPALRLKGFTFHQLRLIQLITTKHFQDLAFVHANGESSLEEKLIVYTDFEDGGGVVMKEVKDHLYKEAEMKLKAATGFRHVIDLLSSEQKLLVGHNSFLDLAHIYSKFIGPLPPTIDEYISSVHKVFPYIIDTKLLLNTDCAIQRLMKKQSTSLSSAFALLCPQIALSSEGSASVNQPGLKIEVRVDDMRSSNWNSGANHEAGYDAFMTGCIFARACSHLGIEFYNNSLAKGLAEHENLQKYINLLYLSWNSGAIIDLRTGNENFELLAQQNPKQRYPRILFENVVLIWGFPSKLKPREIKDCVTKVFGSDSVTSVYYLDGTAAFIQFSKKELVSDFLDRKEAIAGKSDATSVLHPLSELLGGGKTHAAKYDVYKEICNSHAAKYDVYKEICNSSLSEKLFSDQAEALGIK